MRTILTFAPHETVNALQTGAHGSLQRLSGGRKPFQWS